jgi:hypothetical protein
MSKRESNNKEHKERRKSGDLNRKSSHSMRSNDGMREHGINPNAKMMGVKMEK